MQNKHEAINIMESKSTRSCIVFTKSMIDDFQDSQVSLHIKDIILEREKIDIEFQ